VSARRPLLAFALALACTTSSACDELDLPKSWALAYPRVLALRSEVVGDEMRATPEPGEPLRVRVLIAGPKPIDRLSYALQLCPTAPTNGELPACTGEPFAELNGVMGEDAPFADELALELELPGEDALRGVEQVLIAGAACPEGGLRTPPESDPARCEGSDQPPLTWVATVVLARSQRDYNLNPELADDAIAFDGDVWPTAVPADGDEPERIAVIADGEPHEIRVDLEGSGREQQGDVPEELLLSHFTTAGRLERRFSVLEVGDPDDEALTVEWRAPRPPPGRKPMARAKLVFVLRDQRGGVAFTQRSVALE
jgi:hypothetical protein